MASPESLRSTPPLSIDLEMPILTTQLQLREFHSARNKRVHDNWETSDWKIEDEKVVVAPKASLLATTQRLYTPKLPNRPLDAIKQLTKNRIKTKHSREIKRERSKSASKIEHKPNLSKPKERRPYEFKTCVSVPRFINPGVRRLNISTNIKLVSPFITTMNNLRVFKKFLFYFKLTELGVLASLCRSMQAPQMKKSFKHHIRYLMTLGIPSKIRQIYWAKKVSQRHPSKYAALADLPSDYEGDIKNDVKRTFYNKESIITQNRSHKKLERILSAISLFRHDVGYCQGMNFIAAILLVVVTEETAFWLMDTLLRDYKLENIVSPGLPQLSLFVFQLECLLVNKLPRLYDLFVQYGLSIEFFATRWFLTLFSYDLNLKTVLKIWDIFFMDSWKIIFRVSIMLLKYVEQDILLLPYEEALTFLKNFTNETKWPNNLISKSLKIKVTNRLLRDLEPFHQKYPATDIKLIKRASGKLEWISIQEYYRENLPSTPSAQQGIATRVFSKIISMITPTHAFSKSRGDLNSSLDEFPKPIPSTDASSQLDDSPGFPSLLSKSSTCSLCGSKSHTISYCPDNDDVSFTVKNLDTGVIYRIGTTNFDGEKFENMST